MTLNCRGKLIDLSWPRVMGVLNITPDSFYDGGQLITEKDVLNRAEKMLAQGAVILDIGGMSSRPGAQIIDADEELNRVLPHVRNLCRQLPEAIISIDTIHSKVALECLNAGAHVMNDISGGLHNPEILKAIAEARAAYIIMHMQGTPANMQVEPSYKNVTTEVFEFLMNRIKACNETGIVDIIVDPGFGFGKTVEHNYDLLRNLRYFTHLNVPVLAGISRKSMICKVLKVNPEHALTGTIAANMLALMNGASILRVHDVLEAKQTIGIFKAYQGE